MRTAAVVFRRELAAFFDSPLAYVVAICFLLLNSALFVLDFWAANEASLRGWFEWVTWTACIIVPAITMRSWAEERKGGTYDLLLTLPSSSLPIVVGKFLAAWAFFASCLLASLVLPACLFMLSTEGLRPDWGAMAAGYLGTLLLGALLVALGLFLSGLCREQLAAFIVTLLAVCTLRLLGYVPIASRVDAWLPQAGTFVREMVSFSTPHGRLVRGLIGLGDVLYFVAWVAGFLLLNAAFVEESRLRPGASRWRALAVVLGVPVIVLAGSLALDLTPRADLTADRLYTVSPAAERILSAIPAEQPVRVKLYFSPRDEMPAAMASLERDVVERLEALQRKADGRLEIEVVHLHADDAILRAQELLREQLTGEKGEEQDGEAGAVEEALAEEGVMPFRVRTGGLTGTETKVVYAAATITQGAKPKEVLPQIAPGEMAALEQELLTRIWRMTHDTKPVVGLLAPISAVDPQQIQLLMQLGLPVEQLAREQDDYRMIPMILGQGQQYDVRRLRPDASEPIPDDMTTLVLVRPGPLSDRMAWEIRRFLHRGGSLVVAVQAYDYGLRPTRAGIALDLRPEPTGVDGILGPLGVSVPPKMVLSETAFPLSYSTGPFQQPVTVDFRWSFQLDAKHFDHETALANGVGGFVLIQAASPVEKDDAKLVGLTFTPVLSTGENAWTREVPQGDIPQDINDVRPAEGPIPIAALVRGQFPAPEGEAPAWPEGSVPPDAPPPAAVEAKPGSLLVIGTAIPFTDDQIASQAGLNWSGALLKNAVDALSLGDALLGLTVREATPRPLKEIPRAAMRFYEVAIVGLAPALVALAGIAWLSIRRASRRQPYRREAPPVREAA